RAGCDRARRERGLLHPSHRAVPAPVPRWTARSVRRGGARGVGGRERRVATRRGGVNRWRQVTDRGTLIHDKLGAPARLQPPGAWHRRLELRCRLIVRPGTGSRLVTKHGAERGPAARAVTASRRIG